MSASRRSKEADEGVFGPRTDNPIPVLQISSNQYLPLRVPEL